MCCLKCVKRKRRNPENEKKFIRICEDCVNLYLRKMLFEDFWNEKLRKEKELEMKKREKEILEMKIGKKKESNSERHRKNSELKLSSQFLEEIEDSVEKTKIKIKLCEKKEKCMMEEQLTNTKAIMMDSEVLTSKTDTFNKLKAEKDFLKSQQIKDMHRKQDLQLKIKFFLDKILENSKMDRNSYVLNSITQKRRESEDSTVLKPLFSGGLLPSKKMKKLKKNKERYKNRSIEDERLDTNCGGCKTCRCF